MTKNNDNRIMDLKKKIEAKKASLGELKRFIPVTSCIIDFEGSSKNINVLTKEKLEELLIRLNMFKLSMIDLQIETFEFNGYDITDWIGDIRTKIDFLNRRDEEKKLKIMEDKLIKLLSEEKKTELELDDIENLI